MSTSAPAAAPQPSTGQPAAVDAAGRVRAFLAERMPGLERRMLLEGWMAVEAELDALRREVRAAGLWAPAVPRECGGMGLTLLEFARLSEELLRPSQERLRANLAAR